MDLRKTINEKPALVAVVAVVLCVVAFAVLGWEIFGSRSNPQAAYAGKTFFSDDDGKSWFIDDESKIPPFDHNGKLAYRAAVYRCKTGKPFVAYLQKYSKNQAAQIAAMTESAAEHAPGHTLVVDPADFPMDVKKPGDSQWFSATANGGEKFDPAAYQQVMIPVCPDGSKTMTALLPSDPDAQSR